MRHEFLKGQIVADDRDWWGERVEDAITARRVREALGDGSDDVTLHVNSPGGDAMEAVTIDAAIRVWRSEHPDRVAVVEFDGYSASACSYAFLGATELRAHPSSLLMVHDPSLVTYGNAADLRHDADILDKTADAIAAAYVRKTGRDAGEVRDAMRAETWFTAQEALEWGLVDAIADDDAEPPTDDWEARARDRMAPRDMAGAAEALALYDALVTGSGGGAPTTGTDADEGGDGSPEAGDAGRAGAARYVVLGGELYRLGDK